ncbi:MAG: NAD-dependent epimerase/dehydratase family protein [Actinomycetota bacterium]
MAIAGGAGFIGSHFTDRLLSDPVTGRLTLYDNFSSGREWHFEHHLGDPRLKVVRGEVEDTDHLTSVLEGHDLVIHLASNPDIARAATEPAIDFDQGTALTQSVLEAMRRSGVRRILYASGSGVYGDLGTVEAGEDYAPMYPVSTYGASKLAGEALICSYCHMFDFTGRAFRFGNVVGPRQTHGVGFDFARRLLEDPRQLRILGDGTQSKSYIHIDDVVEAVLLANARAPDPFNVYNVATGDYVSVREIADLAWSCVATSDGDGQGGGPRYEFTGGDRGWKGDVPVVRLDTGRIQALGWRCQRPTREALRASIEAMVVDIRGGRM